MLKQSIIAGLALATAVIAFQPVEKAEAKTSFHIGVHLPGPGYYGGGYYRTQYYAPAPRYRRISCGHARRIVRNHGFYRIRAVRCHGGSYVFHAKKRGMWWRMNVRSTTGSVYRVRHL